MLELESINHVALIGNLVQQMCVYLVVAYLLSKTPLFAPLMQVTVRLPDKLVCYLVFSAFCIMGTYLGFQIEGAIANTRAIGAVLGGIFGGPVVGLGVGLTGGLHRYFMGGFTASACAVSTTMEGLIGGLLHYYLMRQHRAQDLLSPAIAFGATMVAEMLQMFVLLIMAKPFDQATRLVAHIALPMILTNSCGAALIMRLILDRREMMEKYSIAFSAKALRIAERSVGILSLGFNEKNCTKLAHIIREDTGVGAVAITDTDKLLGFVGLGADHHIPGQTISSPHTFRAIHYNEVVYADGAIVPYCCSVSKECKLGSCLVIPLRDEENRVFGTIKLYEPKSKFFSSLNRTLGEGIARLLSSQVLSGKIEEQKRLLAQSEIKLLQAQINPHFIYNTLDNIRYLIPADPQRAQQLIGRFIGILRYSINNTKHNVTVREDLKYLQDYLVIQSTRFGANFSYEMDIDDACMEFIIPKLLLQPLLENSIKYGFQKKPCIHIRVRGWLGEDALYFTVEDNGGGVDETMLEQLRDILRSDEVNIEHNGLQNINRRIWLGYGGDSGLTIDSAEGEGFTVKLKLRRGGR